MRSSILAVLACTGVVVMFTSRAPCQVTLIEPGHVLIQHVDSNLAAPLHPSHRQLENALPGPANIESICVDRVTGDVYFQLMFPPWPVTAPSAGSATTHIFRLTPSTGVVAAVILNTGFGIAENGADLHIDYQPNGNLLVTQDQNSIAGAPPRIAFFNLLNGIRGTWCFTGPPILNPGTFGMDFSRGAGGSVVPPGDILFTGDAAWDGIHSAAFVPGLATATHVFPPVPPPGPPPPPYPIGPGDDMVIQPDGDWIWVGDPGVPIFQVLPFPPHTATSSGIDILSLFNGDPRVPSPFTYGSRAAVCDVTGDLYVSFTGATGGSGIFRIDEQLKTATLVLTVGGPNANQGIQDLELGPASFGLGNSVYFTVHDNALGWEQIWEVSAIACCPTPATTTFVPDPVGWNVPSAPGLQSISEFPIGNMPTLGNALFQIALDDPTLTCGLLPGPTTVTAIAVAAGPAAAVPNPLGGFGCAPGTNGNLMIAWPWIVPPSLAPWVGGPAVHSLPIPFVTSLCGAPVSVTGLFIDPTRPLSPFALTERLDLVLGS